jgi:hypothetical protein
MFVSTMGETLLSVKMGPSWPREVLGTDKPVAGHAEIGYGRVFDRIVGFGGEVDFLWNSIGTDSTFEVADSIGGTDVGTRQLKRNQRFMFPISGFLVVDPISHYLVHPVIKGTFGFNMMVKSARKRDSTATDASEAKMLKAASNGFYYGIAGSLAADAVVSFAQTASAFVGLEYQWSRLRKKMKNNDGYYTPNMSGLGIRGGFRFVL